MTESDRASTLNDAETRSESTKRGEGPPVRVAGRLRERIGFWRTFACTFVLSWIASGVPLYWRDGAPPPRSFKNSRVGLADLPFLRESVVSLCEVGAAYEVFIKPTVISPLSIAYRYGKPSEPPKKRLIWNGRYVNSFLHIRKFVYESLGMVQDLAEPDGYAWCFDLTSGYYHVELAAAFHTYVAFELDGRWYQFAVLPFGLAIAPYIFTRVTRELVQRWRDGSAFGTGGAMMIHYIDDFIFFGSAVGGSLSIFLAQQVQVLQDLESCGFLVNWKKTVGVGTLVQSIVFLGFGIDLVKRVFFCPETRWEAFVALVRSTLKAGKASIRVLARIAGKAISFGLALGPVARLFTREMYIRIAASPHSWDFIEVCSEWVLSELTFWGGLDRECFTSPLWPVFRAIVGNMAWTDAGAIGWGGLDEVPWGEGA